MSARLEENARGTSSIVQRVTAAMQGVAGGAQETSRSAQAEDLARTAEQLRAPVARFHAGVGADLEPSDEDADDDAGAWEPEPLYVRRAG